MKQHITPKQRDELSDAQQVRMKLLSEDFYLEQLPSIGQMIEFLDDSEGCNDLSLSNDGGRYTKTNYKWTVYMCTPSPNRKELCDALWEAVKLVL